MDSLARLFGSPARLKVLRLFVFNQDTAFTLEELVSRAQLSKETARKELHDLIAAEVLKKRVARGETRYSANTGFTHFAALDVFIRQTTTVRPEKILAALKKAGTVKLIVLSGLFVGALEPSIDLLVVGDVLNEKYIAKAVALLEAELGREIRYAVFATPDFRYRLGVYDRLIRDVLDYPHRLVLDKIGLK